MKQLLGGVIAAGLLGLIATGQEPGKAPAGGGQGPQPGAPFFEKFDLNKDGKVDWEEFQKVKSGFAGLDADSDGVITPADFTKLMEREQQRMQEEMQRKILERMARPDREPGFRPRGRERGREARPRGPQMRRPGMPPEGGPQGRPHPEGHGRPMPGREGQDGDWRGPEGGPRGEGQPPRRERMWWGSGAHEHDDGDEMAPPEEDDER